jgi:tetratricopeptide (TPR) repeat protein
MSPEFWATDQMRDALGSRDMGVVVRAYRRHPSHGPRPLSQARLCRWLGITQGQLSRIETGHNRVRELDKLIDYARCLRIPSELLWFDVDDRVVRETTEQQAGTMIPLPGGPMVSAAASRTEPALAESLLGTLRQYATTDNIAGPRSLLAVVPQQVAFIERLLDGTVGRGRVDLLKAGARFAEFAGWLYQDVGDLRSAMQWTSGALDMADEANDRHLASYIRMRKSNIASDARKPDLALALARAALQTPQVLAPQVRAVALRQEAYAHALKNNHDACARALEQAFRYAVNGKEAGTSNESSDLANYCTTEYLEMEAAHCWVELNKPKKAISTLQEGLAAWQPTFRRDLGLCLARLGVAHARDNEPEHAVTVAEHSIAIATQTRSHRTEKQLRRIHDILLAGGARGEAQRLQHALTAL